MNNTIEKNDEGFDVRAFLIHVLEKKSFIFKVVILVAVVLAAIIIALRITIPTLYTFQSAIHFVFPDVKDGKYPNNMPFSHNDLLSPIVVKQVYQKNNLKQFNISEYDFSAGLTVSTYSPTYQLAANRFKKRLSGRKLSFAEKIKVEKEMEEYLHKISKDSALIRFQVNSRFGIPIELGEKIVYDIAQTWSNIFINKRGVLSLPGILSDKSMVTTKLVSREDYPVLTYILYDAISDLKSSLEKLLMITGSNTIKDSKSGHTTLSLSRTIKELDKYYIPKLIKIGAQNAKNIDTSKDFMENRLKVLVFQKKELQSQASAITDILSTYSNPNASLTNNISQDPLTPAKTPLASTTQIDSGFVEKLKELLTNKKDLRFRQELVKEVLHFSKQAIRLDKEVGIVQLILSRLTEVGVSSAQANPDRVKVDQEYMSLINLINEYHKTLSVLYKEVSEKQYSFGNHLYQKLAIDPKVLIYNPVFSAQTLLIYFLIVLATALIMIFFSLLSQILTVKRKN